MILHNRDGSVTVVGHDGTSHVIAAGLSAAERDAEIASFFAAHAAEPPPDAVPMWKAKAVLQAAGQLDAVNAAVAQQSAVVQLAWEYAAMIHRHSPAVALIAGLLSYSEQQLDEWFRQADALSL
jgi:hypothetical protein